MPPVLPNPAPDSLTNFISQAAVTMRANDPLPANRAEWETRRVALRAKIFDAIGPFPETTAPLSAKVVGEMARPGYRIEKILYQSRPDVWVTATAYVPTEIGSKKVPAVLVVHGHWPWARRDPIVQSRCLGLVKLGFFVLAVDAFGAGERNSAPARGTYHGALYGATLWPTGLSLLGVQVYDNQRAVDYLATRPEVDSTKLGITGASGGGNQSMNAGALLDAFKCVVPVCSVGNYQSYLKAACCVCEVMPSALTFTEEGDVLSLVAPRHLMVINASRDARQFSPPEAEKSIARAQKIFDLLGVGRNLAHRVFESSHDYNQPMREAMYGWMTLALKNEGQGAPIPEPKFDLEKPEDLTIFTTPKRPVTTMTLPAFAAAEGKRLVAKLDTLVPTHAQQWEATSITQRGALQAILGSPPTLPRPLAEVGRRQEEGGYVRVPVILQGEAGPIPALMMALPARLGQGSPVIVISLDGKEAALAAPLTLELARAGRMIFAPDLRGIGETSVKGDAIAGAPDHNSAEHAIWIGRPLLGQWVTDIRTILDWMSLQSNPIKELTVVGLGYGSIIALTVAALEPTRIPEVMVQNPPVSFVSDTAYAGGTPMGLLVPGMLKVADVPHLAALVAPRRLTIIDGITPAGIRLGIDALNPAFAFTSAVYRAVQAERQLRIRWRPMLRNLIQGE